MDPLFIVLLVTIGWLLLVGKAVQWLAERGPRPFARVVIGGVALLSWTSAFAVLQFSGPQDELAGSSSSYWVVFGALHHAGAALWVALVTARGRRGRWGVLFDVALLTVAVGADVVLMTALSPIERWFVAVPMGFVLFAYAAGQRLARRDVRPDWEWIAFGWWGVAMFLTGFASTWAEGEWPFWLGASALGVNLSIPVLLFMHSARELWEHRRKRRPTPSPEPTPAPVA